MTESARRHKRTPLPGLHAQSRVQPTLHRIRRRLTANQSCATFRPSLRRQPLFTIAVIYVANCGGIRQRQPDPVSLVPVNEVVVICAGRYVSRFYDMDHTAFLIAASESSLLSSHTAVSSHVAS